MFLIIDIILDLDRSGSDKGGKRLLSTLNQQVCMYRKMCISGGMLVAVSSKGAN